MKRRPDPEHDANTRTPDPGDGSPTSSTIIRLAAAVLGFSALSAILCGLYLFIEGPLWRGVATVVAVAVVTVCTVWWWRARGSTTARPVPAVLVLMAALAWVLTDNLSGVPLLVVAITAVVVEYGGRAGVIVGLAIPLTLTGAYLGFGARPLGGIIVNVVLVALIMGLGVIGAQLLAALDRARRDAELAAASRRAEALADMDRALTAERMSHARALHDDLGSRLTLIGMGLDLALRQRNRREDDGADAAWAEVERARAEASGALADLRTLVRALSPLTAGDAATVNLDSALDRLAGAFSGTGLTVSIDGTDEDGVPDGAPLDPLAYRIIQEGLTNVVRHSAADSVTVTVGGGAERTVRVADDGGTSHSWVEPGFGLRHLRDRIESIGGTLDIVGGPAGFVLDARYPAESAST